MRTLALARRLVLGLALVAGSATVMLAGKPAARMGDSTAHGGSILLGAATVMIG